MTLAHCIQCGCHDLAACYDEAANGPCSWLELDRAAGLGVCSACPEALQRWREGDRTVAVPIGGSDSPDDSQAVILEVWQATTGEWGGRLLEGAVEMGRVAGCATREDVEYAAAEIGIAPVEIRTLDQMPPVQG